MGENPWYLMENSTHRLCWEISTFDNLLEKFDARVNISRSMAPLPFLVGRASAAIFF
jgi:hypothetical protein